MTDNTTGPARPTIERDPHRVQVTAEMIASNIAADLRVAPSLGQMSVIGDIYDFAALLRSGATSEHRD
jgi:hypothetical protein